MSAEPSREPSRRRISNELLALAIPALATLVSEPLMLLADSAFIGHLGTDQLAGLGLAGSVISVAIGLCVFLAYGTTATVSRRLGSGDRSGALNAGIDGLVLAAVLGIALIVVGQLLGSTVLGWYGASPAVQAQALSYFRIAIFGFLPLLLILAATGVLRGLQDTRTPLYVAVSINLANIALNFFLIYGVGLGIAGSALGTVIAQSTGAVVLLTIIVSKARHAGVPLRPRPTRILIAARSGAWLFLRTLSLQAVLVLATVVATRFGAASLAAHQVTAAVFYFLTFALDALAIAAQAVVGKSLGAGDTATVRGVVRIAVGWGAGAGVIFGMMLIIIRSPLAGLFTPDQAVQQNLVITLLILGLSQPIAGIVFVLDGVLIGAGDARYLAIAGVVAFVGYLALLGIVVATNTGVAGVWLAWAGYLVWRLITLAIRARGTRWMRLGAG